MVSCPRRFTSFRNWFTVLGWPCPPTSSPFPSNSQPSLTFPAFTNCGHTSWLHHFPAMAEKHISRTLLLLRSLIPSSPTPSPIQRGTGCTNGSYVGVIWIKSGRIPTFVGIGFRAYWRQRHSQQLYLSTAPGKCLGFKCRWM